MLILVNTIHSDNTFLCDILDTTKLSKKRKEYLESLPNGYHITNTDAEIKILGEEFDVTDYCDDITLPSCFLGEDAKIDKIINIDY